MKKTSLIIPLLLITLSYNYANLYTKNISNSNMKTIIYPQKKLPSKWWYN